LARFQVLPLPPLFIVRALDFSIYMPLDIFLPISYPAISRCVRFFCSSNQQPPLSYPPSWTLHRVPPLPLPPFFFSYPLDVCGGTRVSLPQRFLSPFYKVLCPSWAIKNPLRVPYTLPPVVIGDCDSLLLPPFFPQLVSCVFFNCRTGLYRSLSRLSWQPPVPFIFDRERRFFDRCVMTFPVDVFCSDPLLIPTVTFDDFLFHGLVGCSVFMVP